MFFNVHLILIFLFITSALSDYRVQTQQLRDQLNKRCPGMADSAVFGKGRRALNSVSDWEYELVFQLLL